MRRVLPLLALVSLAFAPAPVFREKPVPEAMKGMQGSWAIKYWGTGAMNEPVPVEQGAWAVRKRLEGAFLLPTCAEIVGGVMSYSTNGNGGGSWVLRATPEPGTPAMGKVEIDQKGDRMLGIYKLEGDVLTFCYRQSGQGRPTGFTEAGEWRLVLERKKR